MIFTKKNIPFSDRKKRVSGIAHRHCAIVHEEFRYLGLTIEGNSCKCVHITIEVYKNNNKYRPNVALIEVF